MAERKSLSKKTRFEVFKRDSFTCQYCGAKAPDVILEVDHIKPINDGGSNELLNLVTSCFDCNRGKGSRKIKDNSIMERQRQQIEELNIRRQQLEMMLQWRDELSNLNIDLSNAAVTIFNNYLSYCQLSQSAESVICKAVRKFGLNNVIEQIDICFDKYYKICTDAKEEGVQVSTILNKLLCFLNYNTMPSYRQKMLFLKGIIRNRSNYFNEKKYRTIINDIYASYGEDVLDILIEKAKGFDRFTSSDLENQLLTLISNNNG